jgi:large subunit ribosomal protein L17
MRHQKRGRKLNRTPSHRKAMLRNLVTSLFLHGRVTTTPAKAKEARPLAERLITLARKGELQHRRMALSMLNDKAVVKSLFEEIGPRYRDRPGGYTRILRTSRTRVGDSAPLALFELVEEEMAPAASAPTEAHAAVAPESAGEPASAPDAGGATESGDAAEASAAAVATEAAAPAGEGEAPAGEEEANASSESAEEEETAPTEEKADDSSEEEKGGEG